ncbi:diguanylate cyclase [Comamonas aquatica]|uniref:diguanylate cyclase n=2 Tax=Comamonas aquatica TaxID=225991 RepID=A0AA35GGM1_9BURK|nr:diguanylate cyclase [Comamonas aquatica]MDH0362047.1 GGDEF domain-containing protein [Comamonas aquatica]CAB5660535.1 Probable diguanylate cyclase AdrA [Comamonas aquatica]CAC9691689.1 Probable diguanylate cyclase AdrA [Comamonas aquatica]
MLRVRSSMAMLAVWLMVCSSGVMLWLAHAGYASVAAMTWWALVATGGLVVMAALVRLDLTATWRDPALTFPQILWAVTSSAVAYVLIGEVKGVIHGLLALTLLFAALNLKAKQIVAVSLYALGAFSFAVLFSIHLGRDSAPEIAYATVLLIMLLGCMLLSLQLYQLRVRLRRQRQELVLALAENRELASRDPLTGVLNRRHMLELMHLEQRRCLRGQRTMLLAQMDIDHFKQINDTHGHGVGDLALMTFTQVVRENIRSSDVLARWGGEEFVLLLSDTHLDGALLTLERVRAAVEAAEVEGGPPGLRMTVSMGLAEHQPGEAVELTLDRADKALYAAKHAGRNRVALGEGMLPPPATPAASGQDAARVPDEVLEDM